MSNFKIVSYSQIPHADWVWTPKVIFLPTAVWVPFFLSEVVLLASLFRNEMLLYWWFLIYQSSSFGWFSFTTWHHWWIIFGISRFFSSVVKAFSLITIFENLVHAHLPLHLILFFSASSFGYQVCYEGAKPSKALGGEGWGALEGRSVKVLWHYLHPVCNAMTSKTPNDHQWLHVSHNIFPTVVGPLLYSFQM